MPEADREYPRLFPKPEQTIAGIGRAIREGRVTCVDVLNRCFEQVDHWEPKVHAWVLLDREGATEQAQLLDEELKAGNDRGPLHGVPIGIKDIFDVQGFLTGCGAKLKAWRPAARDAEVVERLRAAGAVIMGKTVTTAYACFDPPVTRNPWNLERTPGGSSSGSAVAVACGMCFGASGSQTGGSITRPASFCGVAGLKPDKTRMLCSTGGVMPLAPSLDHVGPIARSVEDLRLLGDAMMMPRHRETPHREGPKNRPRLGRLRGFFDRRAEAAVTSAFEDAVRALADAGADIDDLDDPVDFEKILLDHHTVIAKEAAKIHSEWFDECPEDFPPRIRELILEGRSLPEEDYQLAKGAMEATRQKVLQALGTTGCRTWITPATVGTAPEPSTTGDPAFNSPWSYTGLPTVSFPIGLARDGLPVAIQFIGGMFWNLLLISDEELLETAGWCERVIRTWRQ